MVKVLNKYYCPFFEYIYMFVMIIYMAQMTPETGRMVGTLSGDPIPFLIPIIMTIILLVRNPISFKDKELWILTGIMATWSIAICYKWHDFSSQNLSYYFFLFYAIFIAFIHIRIYGRDLFLIYEDIIVLLSTISLILWGMYIFMPYTNVFFQDLPETSYGNNFLYLFNWMDPGKGQIYGSFIRNAGCSWEPGRFSIMIIPAIFSNLARKGITFKENSNIIILLLTLASTFSTTGYSIVILLYSMFWLDKFSVKKIFTFILIILPIITYIFSLDFMGEKIQDRADFEELTRETLHNLNYNAKNYGDEYLGSIDRFESAYFEWTNFQEEPLLGYGRNRDYSWFRQEITANFELTGGWIKILSQYGVFVGFFLYIILFLSSIKIGGLFQYQRRFALALILFLSSVSYTIFTIPLFTAFWFYGIFCHKDEKKRTTILKKCKRNLNKKYRIDDTQQK